METFYTVLRIRIKDGQYLANAVQYTNKDAATRQFFSLIATDMGDNTLTYHSCQVIDSNGLILEGRVFDRREALNAE